MSKYNAVRMIYEGESFDSQKEFRRYMELRILERAGEICNLKRQVAFELIPTQRESDTIGPRGGVRPGRVIENSVRYIADFTYYQGNKLVVEDTKGVKTADYIIKRKLMLWVHGIKIQET